MSTASLAPHIALVRLRAEAALIARLNSGHGFADVRTPAQVFLRNPEAQERLHRTSLRPEGTHTEQAKEIAAAIATAENEIEKHESRLTELAEHFALDDAERELLTIAVSYELDGDVRDLARALAARRRAALYGDACQELHPALAEAAALLRALHPNGGLRRGCLLDVIDERGTSREAKITCELSVTRRVLDWLLGDERLAGSLHGVMRMHEVGDHVEAYVGDELNADIERVAAVLRSWAGGDSDDQQTVPLVLLRGPHGSGKVGAAHTLAKALGRSMAYIPLGEVLEIGGSTLLRQALAEAQLRDAVPYLAVVESLRPADGESPPRDAINAIEMHPDLVLISSRERATTSLPFHRPFHLLAIPPANIAQRQAAWERSFDSLGEQRGAGLDADATRAMAGRYIIGAGSVAQVVREASSFAHAVGTSVERSDVEAAVGRQLSLRLGAFGSLITRRARFDEMVLPEDVVDTLRDLIAMVKERTTILEGWGYSKHLGISRGVSALFSGEPGTGKTMAATVLSSELGLELMRIDLSSVVSKWVGETEKHLSKIFDEAQTANAMLLFDEADSLFGKRTEVKSAQDRYANLEVNYILQRMETFDGISVLTTNMEGSIDQAFLRRLNFRVRFPKPDIDERRQLWQVLLPPDTGIAAKVDFDDLANRFEMTGGHIRNAIVRAAVIAARHNRTMKPDDLLEGAHLEYIELGKVMPSTL